MKPYICLRVVQAFLASVLAQISTQSIKSFEILYELDSNAAINITFQYLYS